jgi:uncharacterized protein YyaL (SSP411 family)
MTPNRLIHETSPYLLSTPITPWIGTPGGAEALQKAQREDKPIFLSIGLLGVHWCHVMERESPSKTMRLQTISMSTS